MVPRIEKDTIEYTLTIGRDIHPEHRKECVRFFFETREVFNHFRYALSVRVEQKPQELRFDLVGLSTGGFTIPSPGKAAYAHDFFDLKGDVLVRVVKQGAVENEFQLRVTPRTVRILRGIKHRSPFIEISAI